MMKKQLKHFYDCRTAKHPVNLLNYYLSIFFFLLYPFRSVNHFSYYFYVCTTAVYPVKLIYSLTSHLLLSFYASKFFPLHSFFDCVKLPNWGQLMFTGYCKLWNYLMIKCLWSINKTTARRWKLMKQSEQTHKEWEKKAERESERGSERARNARNLGPLKMRAMWQLT